jgi:F0F1-type ATP synthase membrane subunit a
LVQALALDPLRVELAAVADTAVQGVAPVSGCQFLFWFVSFTLYQAKLSQDWVKIMISNSVGKGEGKGRKSEEEEDLREGERRLETGRGMKRIYVYINVLVLPAQHATFVAQAQIEVEPGGVQVLIELVVAALADEAADNVAAHAYGVGCCGPEC